MTEVILTDSNFDEEVMKSAMPVLVDFYADWCGPCKMISPLVEELSSEYSGKLKVGKMDVDANPETSAKYGVLSIPTLLLVKAGEIKTSLIGFRPKEKLKEEIDKIV